LIANRNASRVPSQKLGSERPTMPRLVRPRSMAVLCFSAATIPIGIARRQAITME